MSQQLRTRDITLEPSDNERLANLCGQFDANLRQIESGLGVELNSRGNQFRIIGEPDSVALAGKVVRELYDEAARSEITPARIHFLLQVSANEQPDTDEHPEHDKEEDRGSAIRTRSSAVRPRGRNQRAYVENIRHNDINFGIGPAGTGKTYLAVACAVESLEMSMVRRVLLVRPAVEAGERLGFLPGDLAQKIDPYLRPLYDALYEMLGFERVGKLVERGVIEVAPLAYMRGRTLNESFIILDEAQNTTPEQMKMFLTRIGFGSTVVVTGDITQVDLPRNQLSGLREVVPILQDIDGISMTFFQSGDVVRHPLVQRIVAAYESKAKKTDEADDGS